MVELRKNKREVKLEKGKYVFIFEQEQVYEKETVEKMITEWKKEFSEKSKWLENFAENKKKAIEATTAQVDKMKTTIESDLENLKEALTIWNVK